jgi:hypothetical protein
LRNQILDRVLDQQRVAMIREASGEAADEAQSPFGFAQQKRATVTRNVPAIETGRKLASSNGLEIERALSTNDVRST